MNLNQAAHGDREFGYIQTRLGRRPQDGRRARRPTRRCGRGSAPGRGPRPARPTMRVAAAGPVRRQHARRRGHRGRQGRGRAAVRRLGQHLRASTTWSRWSTRSPTPTSTSWSPSTRTSTDVAPELRRGRRAARVAALRRPDRAGPARLPRRRAASRRSPPTSRTSAGCGSCPGLAVQRLMADGYGFGGEGDWKTAVAACASSR